MGLGRVKTLLQVGGSCQRGDRGEVTPPGGERQFRPSWPAPATILARFPSGSACRPRPAAITRRHSSPTILQTRSGSLISRSCCPRHKKADAGSRRAAAHDRGDRRARRAVGRGAALDSVRRSVPPHDPFAPASFKSLTGYRLAAHKSPQIDCARPGPDPRRALWVFGQVSHAKRSNKWLQPRPPSGPKATFPRRQSD